MENIEWPEESRSTKTDQPTKLQQEFLSQVASGIDSSGSQGIDRRVERLLGTLHLIDGAPATLSRMENITAQTGENDQSRYSEQVQKFLDASKKLATKKSAEELKSITDDLADLLAKIKQEEGESGVRKALRGVIDDDSYYKLSTYQYSDKTTRKFGFDVTDIDGKRVVRRILDSVQPKKDQSEIMGQASNAVIGGDLNSFKKALTAAFEEVGGDRYDFADFLRKLQTKLNDEDFSVRFIDGKQAVPELSIHRKGSRFGVEFKLAKDEKTDEVKIKIQAFDWVTKQDVDAKPAVVMSSFKKQSADNVLDGKELGKAFDEAHSKNDFKEFNAAIRASVVHAYEQGGLSAVRKLESAANKSAETNAHGPVVLEGNGTLQILNARICKEDRVKEMTAEERLKEKIVEHPQHGYLQIVADGPAPIKMKKR